MKKLHLLLLLAGIALQSHAQNLTQAFLGSLKNIVHFEPNNIGYGEPLSLLPNVVYRVYF